MFEDYDETTPGIQSDIFDFQRCERPDGTFYGIRDGYICRKGRPVGPRVVGPKAPRKPRAKKQAAKPEPRKPRKPRTPKPKTAIPKAAKPPSVRRSRVKAPETPTKPLAPTKPVAIKGDVQTIRSSLSTAERMARAFDRGDLRPGGAKKPGPKVKRPDEAVARQRTKAEAKKADRQARLAREKELRAQEKATRDKERQAAKEARQKQIETAKQAREAAAKKKAEEAAAAKKVNPMEALKAQMAREAAKFEREEAAAAAKKKADEAAAAKKKAEAEALKRETAKKAAETEKKSAARREAEALKAEMAKLAAQFEKEEAAAAAAAAKKKAEAKPEKPQKAEEKPKLDRSELTTRRRELRARVERELKADIEKQSQDPRMKDYLNSLSPAVKQAREQLELKRRIRERIKEEKLVPDKDQIREAQRKLSRKDFAPENGRIKIVALNGKQNTEIENQVNAGLARTRATSKDAEKKIDELMKALERNPIAIGAYNTDPSGGDAKLAQRSNIRGKLTRAGASTNVVEKAIDKKISSNGKERGWAIMNQNTIMLSNAKEVKKLNTPKEAAQLMRLAQKGETAAHWSWSKGSVDGTFIHEVGHIMHQRAFKGMSRDAIIKETEKQFRERGVRANSKYGTTNALETVAELYASYVMYGNQMKREMPETYAWIDEMAKRAYAAD